jgi:hypothetical protein
MGKDILKRKLVAEIETLSEDELPRVLDLIGKLKSRQKARQPLSVLQKRRAQSKNPLRELVGLAEAEPFAHKIDEDLYGKRS